jgi:hypothetical protein
MKSQFRPWVCYAVAALSILPGVTARASQGPTPSMMRPVDALKRAMERFDSAAPPPVFSSGRVTIVDNFAPYVFEGENVPERWWSGFRTHAAAGKLNDLRAAFGAAQDYEQSGDRAFFTLPTRWTGISEGHRFLERGGWVFVLVRESGEWRLRSYAWAVTQSIVAP